MELYYLSMGSYHTCCSVCFLYLIYHKPISVFNMESCYHFWCRHRITVWWIVHNLLSYGTHPVRILQRNRTNGLPHPQTDMMLSVYSETRKFYEAMSIFDILFMVFTWNTTFSHSFKLQVLAMLLSSILLSLCLCSPSYSLRRTVYSLSSASFSYEFLETSPRLLF